MADNYNYSPMGQINGTGDTDAMWLTVFAGEVLTVFERTTIMKGLQTTRTLSGGAKAASFPVTGRTTAKYHDAGTELTGTVQTQAVREIALRRPLVADVFIDSWEEAVTHYDLRSIYTRNLGEALGWAFDQHSLRVLVLAARAATVLDGLPGGASITNDKFKIATGGAADEAEKSAALQQAMFSAAQLLDENYAPRERFCVLRPAEYYTLVKGVQSNGFTPLDRNIGGGGSYSAGEAPSIAGIQILKHPGVPNSNVSQGQGTSVDRHFYGDFSKTIGVVFCRDAAGVVMMKDIAVEKDYQVERQGTLCVAKYACGHGTLRPECAVELKLSALSN